MSEHLGEENSREYSDRTAAVPQLSQTLFRPTRIVGRLNIYLKLHTSNKFADYIYTKFLPCKAIFTLNYSLLI